MLTNSYIIIYHWSSCLQINLVDHAIEALFIYEHSSYNHGNSSGRSHHCLSCQLINIPSCPYHIIDDIVYNSKGKLVLTLFSYMPYCQISSPGCLHLASYGRSEATRCPDTWWGQTGPAAGHSPPWEPAKRCNPQTLHSLQTHTLLCGVYGKQ